MPGSRSATEFRRYGAPSHSLHRPVAVTDGCFTRNLNNTGVRLWAECWPPITIPS